jgi:hypothetical protein
MDAQELRDFEEMFATTAWRRMVKDAEEAIRNREAAALRANNFEEVCYYKGEVAQLSVLISLETAVRLAAAQSAEDDE